MDPNHYCVADDEPVSRMLGLDPSQRAAGRVNYHTVALEYPLGAKLNIMFDQYTDPRAMLSVSPRLECFPSARGECTRAWRQNTLH